MKPLAPLPDESARDLVDAWSLHEDSATSADDSLLAPLTPPLAKPEPPPPAPGPVAAPPPPFTTGHRPATGAKKRSSAASLFAKRKPLKTKAEVDTTPLDGQAPTPPPLPPPPMMPPPPLPVRGWEHEARDNDSMPFIKFSLTPEDGQGLPDVDSLLRIPEPDWAPLPQSDAPAAAPAPRPVDIFKSPPKPGEVLAGFRIVNELGRGAFARVYLAEQIELGNRLVALKVSRAEGDEPQMLARLQHTNIVPIHSLHDDPVTRLRLMCMPYLGGANLAQVIEAAQTETRQASTGQSLVDALDEVSRRWQSVGGSCRSVTAFGRSMSDAEKSRWESLRAGASRSFPSLHRLSFAGLHSFLARLTRTRHRPTETQADADALDARDFDQPGRQFLRRANAVQGGAWIIARLAEGLEHAHVRGLLHRDLKPSNILIAGDGTPMLLDFNLSTSNDPSDPEEGEKAMLGGTLPYMSPEHLDAFSPQGSTSASAVDERSDIYSLGLILFETIAGEPAFPEPSSRLPLLDALQILADQRKAAPSLRSRHHGVPWSLESITRKCLDPVPAKRYTRARDLAEDLNRFLDDRPLKFAPEPSLRERFAKWTRRNPRLCGSTSVAAMAGTLLIALAALVGLIHQNQEALNARLKYKVFKEDAAQCQFLLNITSGPEQHLRRGLTLARDTLQDEQLSAGGDFLPDSWVRRLRPREQAEVRSLTSELILLRGRALARLARNASEPEQHAALAEGVTWLDIAEKLDPSPPSALYADRAAYHTALGNARAAALDRKAEKAHPPSTSRDLSILGAWLLARNDPARAEGPLRRAIGLDATNFWAWFLLGHCHQEQSRPLEAAGDFAACIALEPRFSWPYLNRGVCLARVGRLDEARDMYEHATRVNPRFADGWLNRALVELELDDLPAAERSMARARELGHSDTGGLIVWAEIKSRMGNREGAEKLFAESLAARPDDPAILTARGVSRIGPDPAGAAADLTRALEIDPHFARAHYARAVLIRGSKPVEALAEVDVALRDDPRFLDALQLRALLRARQGDLAAIDDAERLSQVQTPHRLYNAACALSLLAASANQPRLAPRALDLLDRALDAGFPLAHASRDPDLAALRARPDYAKVMGKPRVKPEG